MILSNRQIRKGHHGGHIVIDPFVSDNIRKSSVDVRLGQWFWRCDTSAGVYNPRDIENRNKYFAVDQGPKLAKPYEKVFLKIAPNRGALLNPEEYEYLKNLFVREEGESEKYEWPLPGAANIETFKNIPNDWPVIVLRPHETILAHTVEFIGIYPPGTSEMRARSTWGRNGLGVCKCAGAGDPGYVNRWTYELTNFNSVPLIIPVGERIAQVIFHKTGPVLEGQYGAETGNYKSNYQTGATLEELKASWRPEDMLPKPSKDELLLPDDYEASVDYARSFK
jgi:dCTP deaminase